VGNLNDSLDAFPQIKVWGDTVKARRVQGERITLAIVELEPNAIVPEHRHVAEQLGMVITGEMHFTIDGETRTLGPGGSWRIRSELPHDVQAGPEGAVVVDVFSPVRADWDALPIAPKAAPRWPTGD
jgi:quercetin dioxygenase-like cupin family protein